MKRTVRTEAEKAAIIEQVRTAIAGGATQKQALADAGIYNSIYRQWTSKPSPRVTAGTRRPVRVWKRQKNQPTLLTLPVETRAVGGDGKFVLVMGSMADLSAALEAVSRAVA